MSAGADDSWPEVGVLASAATSERIEAWLLAAGAVAVTLVSAHPAAVAERAASRAATAPDSNADASASDAGDSDWSGVAPDAERDIAHAVLEPAPGEVRLWERLTVVGLFAQGSTDAGIAEALALAAATELGAEGMPEYRLSRLPDTAWERAWMIDYGPMRFGSRFRLVPSYVEPDEEEAITLALDPGLAFGSGTHATTAQCLEWLGRDTARTLEPFAGRCAIDYGCGSGVLAVAAALLGARRVFATDIDPQALAATRANALANGVAGRLTVVPPEALEAAMAGAGGDTFAADLLLANILLGPLEALADAFAALLAPGGTLVLSGLLESQIEPLRLRYNHAFDFAPSRSRDGWALLEATRRSIA